MDIFGMFAAGCFLVLAVCAAEWRGAWVTSWSKGFYTAEEIDRTIADAKTGGLNALVVEVRKVGDAYYQSDLEPVGPEVPDGFDPLAYAIEKGHAEGMQICAWLVVNRVWKGANPPADPKHVIAAHPEWRSLSYDGKTANEEGVYADPGIPEYREHFANVCADIARRYAVDAIHYDYVRYPEKEWGYAPLALERYYAETGATGKPEIDDPKWLAWKRDQMTALVTLAREKIKAANPSVKIQASTIVWGLCPENFEDATPYVKVCQDWKLWMERGLVDENCPMVYAKEGEEWYRNYFRGWLEGVKKWSAGRPSYIGISSGFNTAEQMIQQIEATREAGHPGFLFFAFNESEGRSAKAAAIGKAIGPAPKIEINTKTGA